jgi:hypothetical protein
MAWAGFGHRGAMNRENSIVPTIVEAVMREAVEQPEMAKSSYDEALQRLIVREGGYSNHPSHPGGPINFGIAPADYRQYVTRMRPPTTCGAWASTTPGASIAPDTGMRGAATNCRPTSIAPCSTTA